jgi:hypothetical protein
MRRYVITFTSKTRRRQAIDRQTDGHTNETTSKDCFSILKYSSFELRASGFVALTWHNVNWPVIEN